MTLSRKLWQVKDTPDAKTLDALRLATDGSALLSRLLVQRGISEPEQASAFLSPLSQSPAPPSAFEEMPKAVARLVEAIENQQMILIYGDFDVDGVTGTSLMVEALKTLGAKVSYYLPSRHDEGHGLHAAALCRLVASKQVKVLVTVDNGTGNFNEINLLNGLGVDVIVTDHHELPDNLPFAHAILNPLLLPAAHPFRHLAGAGVAFQLARGLYEHYQQPESALEPLMDLMATGTIVDMVPLKGDNRYWVTRGLKQLAKRERPGFAEILKNASVSPEADVNTTTIGFTIGPRINAVGRVTRADEAVEMLVSTDAERVTQIGQRMEQFNRQRQQWVEDTEREARQKIESTGQASGEKVILVAASQWNAGMVGLVATRLVELYSRPVFVGVIDEQKGLVKFSGRSLPGVHLMDLLKPFTARFEHYGGHAAAGGFAVKVDAYQRLRQDMMTHFRNTIPDEHLVTSLSIDAVVGFEQVTNGLLDLVNRLAPYGQANPEPIFMLENCRIGAQRFLGEGQRHLKLILPSEQPGSPFLEAVYWGWNDDQLNAKERYDIAFKVSRNSYNGQDKLQLVIQDIRVHGHVKALAPMTHPVPEALPLPEPAAARPKVDLPFELKDLRQHEAVDALLLDAQQDEATWVYCEGHQSYMPIPFPASRLLTRHTQLPASGCERLIFWDLPPDEAIFDRLLQRLKPSVVEIWAGKYRFGPLVDSPEVYFKGIRALLLNYAKQNPGPSAKMSLSELLEKTALSQDALMSALSLLAELQLFELSWETDSLVEEAEWILFTPLTPPEQLTAEAVARRLAFQSFSRQLAQSIAYRRWWLTSSLTVLESALASSHSLRFV